MKPQTTLVAYKRQAMRQRERIEPHRADLRQVEISDSIRNSDTPNPTGPWEIPPPVPTPGSHRPSVKRFLWAGILGLGLALAVFSPKSKQDKTISRTEIQLRDTDSDFTAAAQLANGVVPLTLRDEPPEAQAELKKAFGISNDDQPAVRNAQSPVLNSQTAVAPPSVRRAPTGPEKGLFTLKIRDYLDQDGDKIRVLVNGHDHGVYTIYNHPTTLSFPVTKGTIAEIVIKGVHDGGGGITLAVTSPSGIEFRETPLSEGQSVELAAPYK